MRMLIRKRPKPASTPTKKKKSELAQFKKPARDRVAEGLASAANRAQAQKDDSGEDMSDFLCVGDYICLYCEETEGYIFSSQSSAQENGISIFTRQSLQKPEGVPNPHALVFKVCIENRYKLSKKWRKLKDTASSLSDDLDVRAFRNQVKASAGAEHGDNVAEQRRQLGKKVRYGEVIQHMFTGKFIHISTTHTSRRDKNNMLVFLQEYNAKHAQFRILPRYKVKSEGEVVQVLDQIVLESMKAPGQYLHASVPYPIDNFYQGSELNLGVEVTGFTVLKYYKPTFGTDKFLRGGSIVRLFHKELEAYLVAEGLFDDDLCEDAHLRIREVDQMVPRTLYPSTSAITYWQVEQENSILNGGIIRWEQQVRFRHVITRLYLCINEDHHVILTSDATDPHTVFRLHPIVKETDEVQFESYARIEHVLSGFWLHALRDTAYSRKQVDDGTEGDSSSMSGLNWDGAVLRQISASGERMYHDAYTIQKVEEEHINTADFVAGMVPFLLNLIIDLEAHYDKNHIGPNESVLQYTWKSNKRFLNSKKTAAICDSLQELKSFMFVHGTPCKKRQKLMRNLRIIDLLVRLLRFPCEGLPDQTHMSSVFNSAYDVLHTYMVGSSRKNALYFAKYIDFFQTQFDKQGKIGLNVAEMIVELIRDNRRIVDRISHQQIDTFVQLLRTNKNYRYLDLLNVLCVCDGIAIPDNQTYITENWLMNNKSGVYLTERGQNIRRTTNTVYVSTDQGHKWRPLVEFVDETHPESSTEEILFLEHQIDLFLMLCKGRNEFCTRVITSELFFLTWEEAFLCLRSESLPDKLRAKYCELIIGLFIDVGNNYSVLEYTSTSFVYDDIDPKTAALNSGLGGEMVVRELVTIFPVLRDWIKEFLSGRKGMIADQIGHNMLIEQVLRLLRHLVKYGYYGDSDDIRGLQVPLMSLLNGKQDLPFVVQKGSRKETAKFVEQYRCVERFAICAQTKAIVDAKYEALEVLQLILIYQFNTRLKTFVAMFKQTEQATRSRQPHNALRALMSPNYNSSDPHKKSIKEQKRMMKVLKDMFDQSAFFSSDQIREVLLDLINYKYDRLVTKSLAVLNMYFSSKMDLFKTAVQAQVLTTSDSVRMHREISQHIPMLRRLTRSKLSRDQVNKLTDILQYLTSACFLQNDDQEKHPMNQTIMMNHDILTLIFDNISQEIDTRLREKYRDTREVVIYCLRLLKALGKGNDTVQRRIYDRMDTLLKVKGVEREVAVTLTQAFASNQSTCLKIQPRQIERIVTIVSTLGPACPELLHLLASIAKVTELDMPIKRNQIYVIKYVMQVYNKVAGVFDSDKDTRISYLCGEFGETHTRYVAYLVNLFAVCAEGENRLIESICQTILPLDEVLAVLVRPDIPVPIKSIYLRFLHWVYLRSSASLLDSGLGELTHDESMWRFLKDLAAQVKSDTTDLIRTEEDVVLLLRRPPEIGNFMLDSEEKRLQHNAHYFLEAVLPALRTFLTKFYSGDMQEYPDECKIIELLAQTLLIFCKAIKPHITRAGHLKVIMSSMTTILAASAVNQSAMQEFLVDFGNVDWFTNKENDLLQSHEHYYQEELDLNARFRVFSVNCSLLYGGHNTVGAQLKMSKPRQVAQQEYTDMSGDEWLPLGDEFQEHIRCFLRVNEKKLHKQIHLVEKVVQQLGISSSRAVATEAGRVEQEELDIKCLQILRAVIHNEIVKLSDDWELNMKKNRRQLLRIADVQGLLLKMGVIEKVLPLLARTNDDTVRETLAFLCTLLFNANTQVQKALIEYFRATREEVFFLAVRNRMQLSTVAIKERRALAAQHRARAKEVQSQSRSLHSVLTIGRKALEDIQHHESSVRKRKMGVSRRPSLANLQSHATRTPRTSPRPKRRGTLIADPCRTPNPAMLASWTLESSPGLLRAGKGKDIEDRTDTLKHTDSRSKLVVDDLPLTELDVHDNRPPSPGEMRPITAGVSVGNDTSAYMLEDDAVGSTALEEVMEYKDEGYIELVLKVLAQMCDGQFATLQDYLRDQPDNIKSFNLVAETTAFLNMVYSNINNRSIDLVIQIFNTLNEFASGNQENRVVIVTHKIVDYVNFILRAGDFEDCPPEKALELRQVIGNLLYSLIEENGPQELAVAKEVKDTIDKEGLYRVMGKCFELHQAEKPRLEDMLQKQNLTSIRGALQSAKTLAKEGTKYVKGKVDESKPPLKETLIELGFSYYYILQRFFDIDSKLKKDDLKITIEQQRAFNYYRKNSMSIEILKDKHLQKVNFRVKNKNVLREEVKEKLKWSVDRSSPSNKIRDLMIWSKDILNDIHYQRRILSNSFAAFLTRRWIWWNYLSIFLSLAINVLMLVTWEAPMSLEDVPSNATHVPAELHDPRPRISHPNLYYIMMYVMGALHNVTSLLVLVSYFLSNHPQLPNIRNYCAKSRCCGRQNDDYEVDSRKSQVTKSKLDAKFLSFKTFYYVIFFALSLAGSISQGYFFAFHLLNIVNNNQLLGGVIQAVTQNGKSLVWVAILGLVFFYLYAIIGFAFFRDVFDPERQMYCGSLWQCTVTIIRYGLVGDYDEQFTRHEEMNSFDNFVLLALYQVSFFIFITTIGLNIIFGIIVDTFSELRDLKWTAESDMRDSCFICSRTSYDFEHNAQGFNVHVRNDHNMWGYIFFLIHLDDTKPNDYTALDLFVARLLAEDRYDFFPVNRALCLATSDEDSTESRVDELLKHVVSLVQKQKEEESEKKRQEERMQQKRWQEVHRHQLRMFAAASSSDTSDVTLRRMLQVRDTGRPDWVSVEFETSHL